MGQSLIQGLIASGLKHGLCIQGRTKARTLNVAQQYDVTPFHAQCQIDILIIAVKPHQVQDAIAPLMPYLASSLIVSVLAGISVATLKQYFSNQTIVRAMPNLAVAQQAGLTALYSEAETKIHLDYINELFQGLGQTCWLEAESSMHAATVFLGSAPAFFIRFYQGLLSQGEQALSHSICESMLKNALIAALDLLGQYAPEEAMQRVASKGGITQEGLVHLNSELDKLLDQTITAALERSRAIE
ncbi:MAG: hypothetical protein CMF42_05685 [Legionellales bacterium]|nr:hypothetical protein [Legionellales bacterium]OUX66903.1 MAG: hypothetical protein CBD38_04030 [bacterium TMED178]|tara:strand:+ start:9269 stop:10000 length:732 start_codon:yes stop_codon:yes gene_type:complete